MTRPAARLVADELTAEGGEARFVAADLTEISELDRLAEDVGAVDILVNNAGFAWYGPTGDLGPTAFDLMFATNVRAPYFLVAALAPAMASRGAQHHQHRKPGRADRAGRWCRLQRDQGRPGRNDPHLGG